MVKKLLCIGLAAAALSGIGQAAPGKDGGPNNPLWPATWAKYDTNASGRLDDGEWKTLQEKDNEGDLSLWKRFDLNKDGQVEDPEIQDARLDYERWAKKSQHAFDANDDGELSDLEKVEWRRSCPQ